MNEATITVVGNATADADMKVLPSGGEVTSWTLAVTPRVKQGDQFVDGEATFYRCNAWDRYAEPCAETIKRGMRLLVTGKQTTRTFTDREGKERLSLELRVEAVGPDLKFHVATVRKVERGASAPAHGSSGTSSNAPSSDPWADVPPPDEPPPF